MDSRTEEIRIAGTDLGQVEEPKILEEIIIEELYVDGICGVY